ncbi:MAG TPA: hypothetical protein VGC67_17835 [Cellulomonas sp.]
MLLLAALTGALALPAGAATTTDDTATTTTGSGSPVVLVGVTGLRWDDLGSLTTPALWQLSREASVGSTVVRSTSSYTCPSAGWLAISSGGRSADTTVADGTCRTLRETLTDGSVAGWSDYVQATEASSYDSQLGLLGDTLVAGGVTATGIGAGAAIALADSDGVPVGTHVRLPTSTRVLEDTVETALVDSSLVVVDAGTVRDPGYQTRTRAEGDTDESTDSDEADPDVSGSDVVTEPTRAEQVQAIDDRLAAILAAVEDSGVDATVLVVSVADSSRRAQLQVAAAIGPTIDGTSTYGSSLLGSSSTRQSGYLQTTDITPTLLSALGIRDLAPDGALVGSAISTQADSGTGGERVTRLIDDNLQAQAAKPLVGTFYVIWVALNLALYALVTVGLNNRVRAWWTRRLDRFWPRRRHVPGLSPQRVLRVLRGAAVAVAAVPVSTFLANLVPWWRAGSPAWALAAIVVLISTALSLVALLPRWGSWFLGPLGVVAGVTAVVLTVDVATGARLAMDSMMGPGSLVAGRFYGFGNPAFALFATAMILSTVAITNPLVERGRRGAAVLVIAAMGVAATAIDGLPSVGADFGGPPALIPGFAIMALLAAGIRLNWRRVLGVLLAGVVVVVGIAVLDWTRPADERSHLGRFIETVLDGGLLTVIWRKAQANLGILFGSEQTLLAIGGLLLVVLLLGRPARSAVDAPDGGPYAWLSAGSPLRRLGTDAPMLMPGLTALGVTLAAGFALNDSGIVVPATGIALAVPLLIAACATWMLLLQPAALRGTAAEPRATSGTATAGTEPEPA